MRPLCRCRCRCGRQRIQASQIINLNHIRHQSSNYAATSSSFTPTLDPSSRITPNSSSHSPSASSSSSSSSDLASLLARHGLNNSTSSFNASSLQTNATFPIFDPLKLVGDEVSFLRNNVQKLLGSGHPALDTIAKYYFQAEGKHIRPLIVLLISQATNNLAPGFVERMNMELAALRKSSSSSSSSSSLSSSWKSIDDPLEVRSDEVLNDANPHFSDLGKRNANTNTNVNQQSTSNILPSQRRLAEITEMIHVASLLHDDVIDASGTRRSQASAPSAFGNKLSILGGDFLLARASLYLSRLGSNEVVELVASILANLVEGEVMQIKGNAPNESSSSSSSSNGKDKQSQLRLTPEIFEYYMKKTYLKTASLIAKTSRAAVVLGGAGEKQGWVEGEKFKDIAYSYGRNLGIAFQVKLVISFENSSDNG